MIAEFGEIVKELRAIRPHRPLRLHDDRTIAAEIAACEAIDAAARWVAFLGEWCDAQERAAREREVARLRAEHAAWAARERRRRIAREDAVFEYLASWRDSLADPAGVIADFLEREGVRTGHRAAPAFRNLVPQRDGVTHVGPREHLPFAERPHGPYLAPSYTLAFRNHAAPPRPERDHGFGTGNQEPGFPQLEEALEPESFVELRGKEFIVAEEWAGYHDPAEPCPRCHLSPARCRCGNPVDIEDDREHPAFARLRELELAVAGVEARIGLLEATRYNTSADERARLAEIRRLHALIAAPYPDTDTEGNPVLRDPVLRQLELQRWRLSGPKFRELRDGCWRDIPRARPWDPGDCDQFGDVAPRPVREEKWATGYAGFADEGDLADLADDAYRAAHGHRAARVA